MSWNFWQRKAVEWDQSQSFWPIRRETMILWTFKYFFQEAIFFFPLQHHIFQWRSAKIKSKSILQIDWALFLQLEHEKFLEIIWISNAPIEPYLMGELCGLIRWENVSDARTIREAHCHKKNCQNCQYIKLIRWTDKMTSHRSHEKSAVSVRDVCAIKHEGVIRQYKRRGVRQPIQKKQAEIESRYERSKQR